MPVFHSPVLTSCSAAAAKEEVGKRHENFFCGKMNNLTLYITALSLGSLKVHFPSGTWLKFFTGQTKGSLWSMTNLARRVSTSSIPSTEGRKQEFARCEPGSCLSCGQGKEVEKI